MSQKIWTMNAAKSACGSTSRTDYLQAKVTPPRRLIARQVTAAVCLLLTFLLSSVSQAADVPEFLTRSGPMPAGALPLPSEPDAPELPAALFAAPTEATTAETPLPALLSAPETPPETADSTSADKSSSPEQRNYFVPSRSVGTTREPQPPPYVRSLKQIELFSDAEHDWLDLGLDYRFRYEYRMNDIRRPVAILDEPLLTRTRAYIGIKNRFDPLRAAIEFEDARRSNSHFPEDNRDVNEAEIIQAFAELHFADALGEGDRKSVV